MATDRCLLVSIAEQAMALMKLEQIVEIFPVSTSKNSPSCEADSFGTPTGLHCIGDKIGADAPEGMVFKGRVPTGQLFSARSGVTKRAGSPPSAVAPDQRIRGAMADMKGSDLRKSAPLGAERAKTTPTGKLTSASRQAPTEPAAGNLITSRILRLRGLEPGKNSGPGRDSFARYIYIHGTNHEGRIGQPFSGGCVEMLNRDVIRLFEQVEVGDLVWIGL